jgi:AcrR family transcriptional regulator
VNQRTPAPTRRQRQHADTAAEIKAAARAHIVAAGASGLSLRAVARDVGLSAPALYRYFPSLEALVVAVVVDMYGELRDYMLSECDKLPTGDLLARLVVAAHSFRQWAVSHRPEFALMFASLIPGAVISKPGCTSADLDPEAEPYASMLRFSRVFGDLINRAWNQSDEERGFTLEIPPAPDMPPELRDEITRCATAIGAEDVPFDFAYAFHSYWVRLYGLIAMEVFGHLPVVGQAEAYFDTEVAAMAAGLGVTLSRT